MRHPRFRRLAVLAFALLVMVPMMMAAAGYVIYLKDGSTITAKEKYRIENGRALITLLNGTQSFIPASNIDVKRTEEVNKGGHGSAVVLPGEPQDVSGPAGQRVKDKTLADLISSKVAAPRDLPTNKRDKNDSAAGRLVKTKAGFYDLSTMTRKPYPHAEVTGELQQFFRGQGLEEVEIYEGTQGDRLMLEISTNSEGSVFKALTTASNALLHVRGLFPERVAAFELLFMTPSRERAGQFVLTPDDATDLISKKVDVTYFYVKNVQF
jgi:hypothetical protein